ncbi:MULTISPECIES: molybdopterin cofactor-binding domain-containing protein [Tenebrionibacter/Tenebrionicola group]|jgi:CO/xanthine dehydrogenase Mo-binding subunit/CO/xanthine dehydrogenase FAD-binding subunit|uniref:Molybdopterin-dependent oxidoreductase n=2 Tax=Tenebrionibacter/Tenebrionicola group TaxID=2969848 RepID=A0A8K0V631_9ENTR|nr:MULTISPECIES: molybdopterin cofactor-binding domain-containing protein [Tenebrionibacter/Tenebrionicola group]MBK4714820.1 molybdopterin-dependent oxidoreductase [Tenebrionibacter intestinalis]MBV5095621.1 molybdopterin-dependent oxidoreductase [Tenebrionicola larvae]
METTTVGSEVSRIDGTAKVKGSAIYGDDIEMKDMLYGVCRYADIAAGRIASMDLSEALAVPGVVRIATWEDVPGEKLIGVVIPDYPPIVDKEIAFRGDVVAVIAAENYEAACLAAEKIKINYIPWTPISTVQEAIQPGARKIHSDTKDNIINHHHTVKGDIEAGFAASTHIFEREYTVGFQEHAYIEPETITTCFDDNEDIITVYGSVQNAHRVRGFVAKYLNLPQSKVNVKRSILGGSFGGKDDIIDHLACRSALLTWLTGRPVKMTYNREQSMRESYKRHPYTMKYKIGLDENARIQAIKIDVLADGGGYAGQTVFVTWRSSVQAAGPYNIPNVRIDVTGVYTNNSYTSAYRGFGAPQVIFANESLMDEVADALGMSPIELRMRNALRQNDVSMAGQHFTEHTVSAQEVLQKAVQSTEYEARRKHYAELNAKGGPLKYGIGLALSHRGCSLGAEGLDASSALIQINADGSVNISTSVSENGQGLQTTMSLIAAEAFGIGLDKVMFTDPATSMIADGGSTVASRGTLMGGQAILDAANKLKQRMADAVCEKLAANSIDELVWENGKVFNRRHPYNRLAFADVVAMTRATGANLSAYGWFVAPDIHWDEEKGTGNPYFTWVYGCQVADIVIDTRTGKIHVNHATAVHDVGKVINKVGFEGQVSGGVAQGMIGYGMLEEFNIEHGEVKSENFDTYLLPTIKDMPPMTIIPVENHDKAGPYGAKVIGEPVLELGGAALNNAVSFALGKRNYALPLTLEQVKLGYALKKPVRQSEQMVESGEKKQVLRLNTLDVKRAKTLDDALALLAQEPERRIIAGGTDVLVQARLTTSPVALVDISGIPELRDISALPEGGVRIGAGVRFSDLTTHPLIAAHYPLLVTACNTIGSLQLRNRATIGGNIVNAAPCADSVPPLIIHDAKVEIQRHGEQPQQMPLSDFIISGYQTQLKPGELLSAIVLPPPPTHEGLQQRYLQLGRRNALNITRQSFTGQFVLNGSGELTHCRVVDGALFNKPQRLIPLEKCLTGRRLNAALIEEGAGVLQKMLDDAIGKRWSAAYKVPVGVAMFKQMLEEVLENKGR